MSHHAASQRLQILLSFALHDAPEKNRQLPPDREQT
jgi:hypothetical protein